MDNAVVTNLGSQPSIEQAKAAKKADDFIFNEEPAEEREPQSLEEALPGWVASRV